MNEVRKNRSVSILMSSSTSSTASEAETQHLDESETPNSVTECDDWNPDQEPLEESIRSQLRRQQRPLGDVVDGGSQVNHKPRPVSSSVVRPDFGTREFESTNVRDAESTAHVLEIPKLPEVKERVQDWVNEILEPAIESTTESPASILWNLEQFVQLYKAKLPNWVPKSQVPDQVSDEDYGFETIMNLLSGDHVPEAMMIIIHILSSPNAQLEANKNEKVPNSPQAMMLRILSFAVQSGSEMFPHEELDSTKIEKLILTMGDLFNADSAYFAPLSMELLRPQVSYKNHVILAELESYVNQSIKLALECRKTIFDIDFANMRQIVEDVNIKTNNFLSTEQQCKLARKVYTFVRKSIYSRCHQFLTENGFAFDVIPHSEELPSSLESNMSDCVNLVEESVNLGSQPESQSSDSSSQEELNSIFVPGIGQVSEAGLAAASAIYVEEVGVFYDDNAQAIPLGNEYEVGRYDSLENEGFMSSASPTYSLSIPRMSQSPVGSSEDEASLGRLDQLPLNSSFLDLGRMQRRMNGEDSSSDDETGFHSERKRNRLDSNSGQN